MSDEEASFQLRMSDSDAASCEEGSGAMFGLTSREVLSLPQEMQSVLQSTQETLNQRKRRRQDEQEAFEKRVRRRQEHHSATKQGWDFKLREVALLAVQVPEGPLELRKILQNEAHPEVAWTEAKSTLSKRYASSVCTVAGTELAAFSTRDLSTLIEVHGGFNRAVRRHLAALIGVPTFRQKLLLEGHMLQDDDLWDGSMKELQLVVLPFSRDWTEDLWAAVRKNSHLQVKELLEQSQDPNVEALALTPLLHASSRGFLAITQLLLEASAEPDRPDANGQTPLRLAGENSYLDTMRALLQAGADKDLPDSAGATPLLAFARDGSVEVFRLLLESGADKDGEAADKETPLLAAARAGHKDAVHVVRLLLEAKAAQKADRNGETPLHAASQNGLAEIAELLISRRADVDRLDRKRRSPLLVASRVGCTKIARLLLAAMADPDVASVVKDTPLFVAALHGHLEAVRCLLKAKAQTNVQNCDGTTPLSAASEHGHVHIVQELVCHGGDLDRGDLVGASPLLLAAASGHLEVVLALIEARACVDLADRHQEAPLLVASRAGFYGIVRALINVNARHLPDATGATPLRTACANGHARIVKALLQSRAHAETADLNGTTPLLAACRQGQTAILEALLAARVDVNRSDESGSTPLLVATGLGHLAIVRCLVEARADVEKENLSHETPVGRLLFGAKALQHRLGKRARQHAADATGQYEASATLIASGAQLELRNCRGLDGDRSECKQITSLALEDGMIEVLLARCLPMAVDWDGNVGKDGNDLEILSDAPEIAAMDSADDVGVPVRRKQKKHFLEDSRLVWELLGDEPSSDRGCHDLHRDALGRRGSGLCRGSDSVPLCLGQKARSVSPQTQVSPISPLQSPHGQSRAVPDEVAEYGFTRLRKSPHGGRRDASPLAWPEPSEGFPSPTPSYRACSRRQDSRQARACLELFAPDVGSAAPSSMPSARSRSSQGWVGWGQNEVTDRREQERVLLQEEVQSGMTRRSGRCMRDGSLRNVLRHTGVPHPSSCDDLRQDKILPRRGSRSIRHANIVCKSRCPADGQFWLTQGAKPRLGCHPTSSQRWRSMTWALCVLHTPRRLLGTHDSRPKVLRRTHDEGTSVMLKVALGSTHDGRGRCLLATEDADAGDCMIRERASFTHDMGATVSEQGAALIWEQFHQLPSEVQDAIWGLYCPEALEESPGYILSSKEQRRLLGILKVNSVKLRGPGAGVFLTISRANHSCRPTCAFVLGEEGMCSLVAVRQIKAGEEVTVSYISESSLLLPVLQRRSALYRPWQFHCQCERCIGFDDTRGHRCSRCGRGIQWASADSGVWQACDNCGGHMDDKELRQCLSQLWLRYNAMAPLRVEAELVSLQFQRGCDGPPERKEANWMTDLISLHRTLRDSPPPSPGLDTHWIGSSIAELAAEAHLWRGEFDEAAAAAKARVAFVKRVLRAETVGLRKMEATLDIARRMKKRATHRSSSRMAAVLSPCRAQEEFPSARAETPHSRRAGSMHKASDLWAPWLLNYEKELHEQRTRLSSASMEGRAGRPAPAPFPCGGLHLAGGSVRDTGIRRGRSPDAPAWDAAGKAAKEPTKPLLFTCPFWRGDSESTATPESTTHAHFNGARASPTRSPSPSRSEASAAADKCADVIQWFKAPEAMPLRSAGPAKSARSSRRASPRRAEEDQAMAPHSSPSRFHEQPSRLHEQLAQETFLVAPASGRAGKPTDLGFDAPKWPAVESPRSHGSVFPQSLSPPALFAPVL
ncbi:ANK1 [Symbiodinium microadriaticum]|nr:ANK1 [Symbiodinium microadriaticum]